MLLNVYADRINRKAAPERLPEGHAVALRHVDVGSSVLAISRGPGLVRASVDSGISSSRTSAHVLRQANGRPVLIWAADNGDLKADMDVEPAYLDGDY